MEDKFYKYVKNEIKRIPNSAYLNISVLNVKEDDFLSHINQNYQLELINFCQNSEFCCDSDFMSNDKVLKNTVTYHYKINKQLYLEYIVISDDLNKNYPYIVKNLTVYSNDINKNELVSFIQDIGDYVKNK